MVDTQTDWALGRPPRPTRLALRRPTAVSRRRRWCPTLTPRGIGSTGRAPNEDTP
jgi:hypothetical protein